MRRIAAEYLYTLEGIEPLRNAFVEVDDFGTILRTGLCADPFSEREFYKGAVVPGFVNTHCHIELSYLKGLFRRGTGMAGFIDQINELRDNSSHERKVDDIRYWMDTMWLRGISAMADISNCDDSFGVKAVSPMYTRTFLEVFGTEPDDCQSVMRNVQSLQERADEAGIDAAPTPHACYTMSPALVTAASAAGLKSGFLSFHCEETPEEEEMLMYGSGKMYENRVQGGMSVPPVTGKSSLEYFIDRLERIHQAPFEENILLVHEVCLTPEGIDAIRKAMLHPYIALCPRSNIFIHNMLPPVYMMRDNLLELTIGTDSLSSNDDLDMVGELYCLQENFPELYLGELLTWACMNGAAFLKMDATLGSMEAGKHPGLVHISNLSVEGKLTAASVSHRII